MGVVVAREMQEDKDKIYEILRLDILELKLRPGLIFSIKDISEMYEVGRSPVRDALISLSKEGLITFLPQRGTMVSKINCDKVKNERFLRTCVEENVMLEFMAVCDLKAITELEMSLNRQLKSQKDGNIRDFIEEDMYFHSIFYYGAKKGYIYEILSANSGNYGRLRLLSMAERGIESVVLEEHRALVDAVLVKDSEQMHKVLDCHLNRLVSQERPLMIRNPELFDQQEVKPKRVSDELGVDFLVETKLKYHV